MPKIPSRPGLKPIPIGAIPVNPNILHFAPDDFGREYLRIYNRLPLNLQIPLPNISRLAQQGVTFTRAYSQPWCSPTRAAWLTGRYGFQTGIGSLAEGENQPLLATEVCLPAALKTATSGLYTTAAFGKWHLSEWATKGGAYEHPARVGFDHFEGHLRNLEGGESYDQFEGFSCEAARDGSQIQTKLFQVNEWAPKWLADRAVRWIKDQEQPWWVYFAMNLPHTPYNRPPAYAYDTDAYVLPAYKPPGNNDSSTPTYFKAMVQAMDWTLGYLLEQIPQNIRAVTTVMLWSDNGTQGESFDTLPKDGIDLTPYLGANYPSRSKRTVYELGINIPAVVAGAKVTDPGRTSDALVSPADLFDTVLDLAGGNKALVPLPPGGTRNSTSFHNVITAASAGTRTKIPVDLFGPNGPNVDCSTSGSRALVYQNYKLIKLNSTGTGGFPSGTGGTAVSGYEFYQISTDPNEQTNLIGTTPINLTGATLTAYNTAVADYATAFSTL